MTLDEARMQLEMMGSCSAIIKMADNFSDIFAGHSTWSSYVSMNRIFKYYNFSFNNPSLKNKNMAFSSYPGVI